MNGADWKEEIKKLTDKECTKHIEAIETLMNWNKFEKEWAWTGINRLKYLLEEKIVDNRKCKRGMPL